MYVFAAPEYLGNFLTYGEASIFTKAEADIWLSTFAHETIGMSMPNRAAAFRADFTGVQDSWIDDDEYADDESTAASPRGVSCDKVAKRAGAGYILPALFSFQLLK